MPFGAVRGIEVNFRTSEWMTQGLQCFIYQHGIDNGKAAVGVPPGEDFNLLRDYGYLNLSRSARVLPWAPKRSLRVVGPLPTSDTSALTSYLSPELVELDLTTLHP